MLKKLLYPSQYVAILTGERKYNGWFLVLLIIVLMVSVQPLLFVTTQLYPVIKNLDQRVEKIIDESYTEGLEITIKDGKASTNVTEPHFITVRREAFETIMLGTFVDKEKTKSKIRVLVIDTKAKATDIEKYQTYALLTEDQFIYNFDKNRIINLSDVRNQKITKNTIKEQLYKWTTDQLWFEIARVWGLWIAIPLILIGQLISTVIGVSSSALIIYFIARINQTKISFGKAFKFDLALELIVTPLLLGISLIPEKLWTLRYSTEGLLSLLFFALAYRAIKTIKKNQEEQRNQVPTTTYGTSV